MRRLWVMAITMALGACGGPGGGGGGTTITVETLQYDARMLTQRDHGGVIDLVRPPQGGFVIFVGTRVTGLAEETVELKGLLKDDQDNILSQDPRTITMKRLPDGSHTPDLASYLNVANIAVCPSASTTDRHEKPFTVELVVTELGSRRFGVGRTQVLLSCRQTDAAELALCRCECEGNYMLGKCSMP